MVFLLTSIRIIISGSILVAANDIISFFSVAEYYSICVCVCVCVTFFFPICFYPLIS